MADKKLRGLIAQRDSAVSRLEEIKVVADNAINNVRLHTQLKIRVKHLEGIVTEFNNHHASILNIVAQGDDDDLTNQQAIRKHFDENFYSIQATCAELFDNTEQGAERATPSHVKLPKLELKKFNGTIKNWKTFIDLYDSIIHNNSSLSNVEKFTYLLNSLEGPPLSIVQCTPLTDNNYNIAYNTLKGRYENNRLISVSHWREIEKTVKLSDEHDAKSLQTLLDTFTEHLTAIENMGHPVSQWDFVLFYMLFDRLDSSTATRFELECGKSLDEIQNKHKHFEILLDFLKKQCIALDTVSSSFKDVKPSTSKYIKQTAMPKRTFVVSAASCYFCHKNNHSIYKCSEFLSKNSHERYKIAKTNKWCTNCLGLKHNSFNCSSRRRCEKCSKPHHTLLHHDSFEASQPPAVEQESSTNCEYRSQPVALTNIKPHKNTESSVLLATAQIRVLDSQGQFINARILLDSASQVNFITNKLCKRLGLVKRPLSLFVKGLGDTVSNVSHEVTCTFTPKCFTNPKFSLDFAIIPKICENLPSSDLPTDCFTQFSHLELADESFNVSAPIDMLVGGDVFGFLVKEGQISQSINKPVALNTQLGWIIMGRVSYQDSISRSTPNSLCATVSSTLLDIVKRFWQLEQVPNYHVHSPDEVAAEEFFQRTHTRNSSGRYVLQLPFKNLELPVFENTRDIALRRFYSLERRLESNPELHDEYRAFMQVFLDTGHMEILPSNIDIKNSYYIPHHCILRPESSTTKLRVVFDASAKAANNISLNDTLLVGPKLQQDIFHLLLKFRIPAVAFTADIKQMFRQILIDQPCRNFQRILWRFSKSDRVRDYQLNTVTYGVASSPYQAIRTLTQLARDYKFKFPRASEVLENEIFVDDVVSGTDSIESALALQQELISLLSLGGFELRKWASNTPLLISHLDTSLTQLNPLSFDKETDSIVKILGLQWNPLSDSFVFKIESIVKPCTKRNILSDLARIFDPLGFLSPVTVSLKIIIQQLWSSGLDWDQPAPNSIKEYWSLFKEGISTLSSLLLPRKIIPSQMKLCEMHGFCDSSEKAYAAVVYFRIITYDDNVQTYLLCSKSRVAPLKTISIPRLELCSAVLLADLMSSVKEAFADSINISSLFAWTDSTVALSWIKSSPHKWTTFVSNRVSYIQEKLSADCWAHVRSENNPADSATRGLLPSELLHLEKWWTGPGFLTSCLTKWVNDPYTTDDNMDLEKRKIVLLASTPVVDLWNNFISRFSSLSKIIRIVAYVLRFCAYVKAPKLVDNKGHVTLAELDRALLLLIREVQKVSFAQEMAELSKSNPNLTILPKYIRKLSPFLDKDGVLRVGGRLKHASLSYNHKHPCLLPRDHRITFLIIEQTHIKYMHPGLQTTQFLLSQRFWIPSSRRIIKKVLSSCMRCFRCNPSSQIPLMGDLPSFRVNQVKCFTKSGVDFGGPYLITMGKHRGSKTCKAYICLFVCLCTKALHLELVTELSSDAFLAALRRFVSRRGRVTDMFSDCGTNFVGASKELMQNMRNASIHEGIVWHFNPPSAPNFGGIWEAGIKAVKGHLHRVVGSHILTYEEFNTVLTSIEAILNSRPLCSLSSDPNDLNPLTPSHFLNLEPLNTFVKSDLTEIKLGRLSRWQLIQRIHQDFWKRWHNEYLHTLNQRSKWYDTGKAIEIDSLVLLKEDNAPPLSWLLGRVIECFPGRDGITRVVAVKTHKGILRRPVSKLCSLPNN
ncbi:uncharacterized protein LOC126750079 [Anthonomus grandis grandis]|uniref:uncharacterized protein LOC126750079 n=1 Tax=Anthonomus grandis grandis TaxID=2921223 RepID=UPI00216612EC|nr:uncharacterized protein LOC126750079 [Anthonomus grandis grandis]